MKRPIRAVLRNRHFLVLDLVGFGFAAVASFYIRLELTPLTPAQWQGIGLYVALAVPLRLMILHTMGIYRANWILAGAPELLRIAAGCIASGVISTLTVIALTASTADHRFPIPLSVPLIDMLFVMILIAGARFGLRVALPPSAEHLLRRAPVSLDISDIRALLAGQTILITGAGGSIGMELACQIAHCGPGCLLLLGHGENSLFATESRLRTEFPDLPRRLLLADVRDTRRMAMLFTQYRPAIVFHAAAHKHVPMLENNVIEAVANNLVGTRTLIDLCNQFAVQRMVMISTDKAVNPTNIMGMSKRAAELAVIAAAQQVPRRFAVVRFGNVLGSRGSALPIFQQQIAAGGPVTITSEHMTRFIMSLSEAALLVLKAAVLTDDGPLFVLNMGEPVRIVDLARDLIRLNGLEPGRDIQIQVIGPRPGEKLTEELFYEHERRQAVEHGAIFSVHTGGVNGRESQLIHALSCAVQDYDEAAVLGLLTELVAVPATPVPGG